MNNILQQEIILWKSFSRTYYNAFGQRRKEHSTMHVMQDVVYVATQTHTMEKTTMKWFTSNLSLTNGQKQNP